MGHLRKARAARVVGRAQDGLLLTEAARMTWTSMAITFGGLALAFQLGGPDSVAFRPTGRAEGRLGLGGSVVTTEGNSVASARVALERAKPPYPIAYAEA